jgi:precorrin-2 dehydrogenase/sirohydrochlorin ferrochelatase
MLTESRMIKVSDTYSLEDLCEMDEEDMATLLRFYAPDKVPRLGCLKAMEGQLDAFDGSFGFCVGWG